MPILNALFLGNNSLISSIGSLLPYSEIIALSMLLQPHLVISDGYPSNQSKYPQECESVKVR
jgi:hypothetical protein